MLDWKTYENFLSDPDSSRMRKILVRYNMYWKIRKIPGDIVEVGVHNGSGLFTWLKFLEIFEPSSQRILWGFDTFAGFPKGTLNPEEKELAQEVEKTSLDEDHVQDYIEEAVRLFKATHEVRLVAGAVEDTASEIAETAGGWRIALYF